MIWMDGASLWDHAIKTNPGARAYISRGDLYKEAKKYDLAIQCYSEAIKINIADQEAYTNRGNVYFELNNYEKALADYKKAHSIDPNYVTAIDNIGAIFGLQLRYDSALFYFNKALQANPHYIPSYRNRGLVNIELSRNEDAIKDFKKILEYDINNPDVMNMVGVCYRNLGKFNDAIVIISEAIRIKPDPRFYLNRAYCYRDLKDFPSARKDAQIAKQGGLEIDAELAKSLE
jgi:tetratricopeptide (TPR) repeat protein